MPVYLGLDLSTQSVTALAIEVSGRERRVAFEESLDFDGALPQYGTRHGVLPQKDPLVATSSPLMWAEALDRMMEMVARDSSIALADILAISGSGQQHGSVYFGAAAAQALASLDAARSLESQMRGVFVRPESPIWMDSSTAAECAEISTAVGGPERLAMLTGSRAFERFTGPQIRKFFKELPAAYRSTTRIHLVSSYAASLLVGFDAPIEPGDGSGMNLMDLAHSRWASEALAATAPDLEAKLPPIAASWTVVGPLATFWRARYGFPAAKVVAWSGDNPCSLVGTGIVREGTIAISLGTSDTLFGLVPEACYDPSGTGHVFGSPTGGFMPLICCKNGSLARERIRDEHRRRVRRDHRGGGRPGSAGAAHRLARLRALHRAADPEVLQGSARGLPVHHADPPRVLVRGVAAGRLRCADRPRRRLGDEPDGPGPGEVGTLLTNSRKAAWMASSEG